MEALVARAVRIGDALRDRGESVAVGEGACGGLLSAALVAVPGASSFYLAGAVLYTRSAFVEILGPGRQRLRGLRGATPEFSLVLAELTRDKFGSTWAIGESGASGPSGNRYGDPAGHAALAVSGPVQRTRVLETGIDERLENMRRFAAAALDLLGEAIANAP